MATQENRFIPVAVIGQEAYRLEIQPAAEKLKTARGVVLFDLDKTAVDEKYNPTDLAGARSIIASLQKNGVVVGIHSDTPLASMIQFASMFGTEGPLIYEMGGIYFPNEKISLVLDPEVLKFFPGFRDRFFEEAKRRFPDTMEIIHKITKENDRNKEKREGARYPGFDRGIFINPYRLLSFGLWAEGINRPDGSTFLSPEFHQQVDALLKAMLIRELGFPDEDELKKEYDYDFNSAYGVTIVKKKALSSKTPPIQAFLSLAPDYRGPIYMVGDSPADFIDDPRVITLAVANAKPELRARLAAQPTPGITHISHGEYTQGLIEHLEYIAYSLGIPH